jgi:hypothetical protein
MLKRLDFGLASTGTMKLNADAPTKDDCTQQSDAALTMETLKLRLKQLEESNAGLQFQLDKATSKLLEHQKNVERNEDLLRQVEQLAAELKADHIRFTHLEGQNSALQCQLDKKTVDFDKAVCDLLDSQKENKVLMAQTRNLEAKLAIMRNKMPLFSSKPRFESMASITKRASVVFELPLSSKRPSVAGSTRKHTRVAFKLSVLFNRATVAGSKRKRTRFSRVAFKLSL